MNGNFPLVHILHTTSRTQIHRFVYMHGMRKFHHSTGISGINDSLSLYWWESCFSDRDIGCWWSYMHVEINWINIHFFLFHFMWHSIPYYVLGGCTWMKEIQTHMPPWKLWTQPTTNYEREGYFEEETVGRSDQKYSHSAVHFHYMYQIQNTHFLIPTGALCHQFTDTWIWAWKWYSPKVFFCLCVCVAASLSGENIYNNALYLKCGVHTNTVVRKTDLMAAMAIRGLRVRG